MNKFVLSVALMVLSAPVLAADLSAPEESPSPQAKPLPRWTGFYLGFTRGFGGGVPRMRSSTQAPRNTGEVRFG